MRIALVIGKTVATMKDERLNGRKLLLVQYADPRGNILPGEPFIAVDTVDAGPGDLVVLTEGSSARQTDTTTNLPVDAIIVAVIDTLETDGKVSFRKG
jgi:microcompartment protein CcmK/EutM